jgi:hypothetical protein
MSGKAKKRMAGLPKSGPKTKSSSTAAPQEATLYFSQKDLRGCLETETVYLLIISTSTGVRRKRLYTKANNDESAREAFNAWLEENPVYRDHSIRRHVIVQKHTRILIATRIA